MKTVPQSAVLEAYTIPHPYQHGVNLPAYVIEKAGRTCYKSEDKMGPGTTGPFIRMIRGKNHASVLEHASATFRIVCDRGVSHEIVRHRIASYSQESTRYCVAGTSRLTTSNPHNRPTIADLFENKENSRNGAWKRVRIRQYNESTGVLQFATIKDIVRTGIKPTIELRSRLGYSITLTADHKVYTDKGYVCAGNLVLGDRIAVNGTELLYRNREWLDNQYTTLAKTAVEIGMEFGFNPSTIKKWVRIHELPGKPKSYWNKGRTPWNKGLSEHDDERVHTQANALRDHHWNEGRIIRPRADRVAKLSKSTYHILVGDNCEICGTIKNLNVHHLDEDRDNNTQDNLFTACVACHQQIHARSLKTIVFDPIVHIEQKGHTEVFDLSMNGFHNFVANGIVVHNCNYSKERFGNEITVVQPPGLSPAGETLWRSAVEQAELAYFDLLHYETTPQIARSVLPTCLKTELVMTANFREWLHFIDLRTSQAAHPQMREVALLIQQELIKLCPEVFEVHDAP